MCGKRLLPAVDELGKLVEFIKCQYELNVKYPEQESEQLFISTF
jgi:hypothetical protein